MTQSDKKITDLPGLDFEITTTLCSGFGASARTKVWGSRRGERAQTLLFDYDPIYRVELPEISMPEPNKIAIAVPWINQTMAWRSKWQGMQIEYDIGKLEYPSGGRVLDDKD
jgi:hypothetical protein